jgi:hypothetical protein
MTPSEPVQAELLFGMGCFGAFGICREEDNREGSELPTG